MDAKYNTKRSLAQLGGTIVCVLKVRGSNPIPPLFFLLSTATTRVADQAQQE